MDLSRSMDPKIKKVIGIVLGAGILLIVVYAMFIGPLLAENEITGRINAVSNPIEISTEEELMKMQPNGNYILKNDITLSANWTPVATRDAPFCGILSGNGYTIHSAGASNTGGHFPGLIKYASNGCLLNEVSLDGCNAVEGAFIAKISGTNGKIFLYKCSLSGDELPYYCYSGDLSDPAKSNFNSIQVGYGAFLSSNTRNGLFVPQIIEIDDKNGNKITFFGCSVSTQMTTAEARAALDIDRL